jgi:hypothetical protein
VAVVGRQVAQVLAQVVLVVMVANMVVVVVAVKSRLTVVLLLGVHLKVVLLELSGPVTHVRFHQQIQVTCNEPIY